MNSVIRDCVLRIWSCEPKDRRERTARSLLKVLFAGSSRKIERVEAFDREGNWIYDSEEDWILLGMKKDEGVEVIEEEDWCLQKILRMRLEVFI